MKLPLFLVPAYLLGGLLVLNSAVAQEFRIADITVDQGRSSVSFQSKISAYYVLYRGGTLESISTPIGTRLGTGGILQMSDPQRHPNGSFYRVQEVPRDQGMKRDDNPTVPDVEGQFMATKRHA